MNINTNHVPEPTLYVCRDCGEATEEPSETSTCPDCDGRLMDTTVPHD